MTRIDPDLKKLLEAVGWDGEELTDKRFIMADHIFMQSQFQLPLAIKMLKALIARGAAK